MVKKASQPPPGSQGTIMFLPRMYDETLLLLAESHNYFEHQGAMQQRLMGDRVRVMFISEMSRITLRLSCVMAWILARRAVLDGSLSKEAADENHALECRDICLHQHIEAESLLPKTMSDILDRSYELYQRVARLDDENSKTSQPPVSPISFS